jgi:uncharacterized coiled-coil protein SlyX
MTATGTWADELDRMGATIAATLADAERRVRAADDALTAPPSPAGGRARRLTGRFDDRVRKLAERVAAAEQSADTVGAELAAAETDLRRWAERLAALRQRFE